MSIVHVRRIEAPGDWSAGNRQYSPSWRVRTDDPEDQAVTVLQAVDPVTSEAIPGYLEGFAMGNDSDIYSRCVRIRCRYEDPSRSKLDWIVSAEFSSKGDPPDEPDNQDQPWTRRAKWAIRQSDYTEIVLKDVENGDPILNLAHQQYDPPVDAPRGRTLIDVTYYTESYKLSTTDTYRFSVNSNTQWGYTAKRLRLNLLEATEVFENNKWYWERHAQVEAKATTEDPAIWIAKVLEEGMLTWDATNSKYVLPQDDDQNYHTVPVLLDATGGKLPKTGTPLYSSNDANKWRIHEPKDFGHADLALPDLPTHLTYS